MGRADLVPCDLLEGAIGEEVPGVATLGVSCVVAASGCSVVDDHRVKFVKVISWVEAVALHIYNRRYFDICIVFAEVVVEAFEGQNENGGRVFHVELSHCFLGLAAFAGEVIFLAEVLRSEEGVYDAAAFFELGVDEPFFFDFCFWDLAFRKGDLLVKGF